MDAGEGLGEEAMREGVELDVREVRMGWGKRSIMVAPKILALASRASASWMVEREDMMLE